MALWACALTALSLPAQEGPPRLSLAAATSLEKAKDLLQHDDVPNAILMLENQLPCGRQHADYVQTTVEAYSKQLRRYQDEGKVTQAAMLWDKIKELQTENLIRPVQQEVKQTQATPPSQLTEAEQAFQNKDFAKARQHFQNAQDRQESFSVGAKERFAYCRLQSVAARLNAAQGQIGDDRPQLEREVREALTLAPRLEFGKELLHRLQVGPQRITQAIQHLPRKEGSWSVSVSKHFRAYHSDPQLAEQVLQIAEQTRSAVSQKWLGQPVDWSQPCQIYIHPTADSYHRQSGMPATAPGHSDYDADKTDASIIHVRRVFVRADHPHMLTAILPHEVTHVVLNGQFGRKLLPRWADEGMAVLSEPYARIGMHLEPLPKSYQDGKALSLAEILSIENYPPDRSKMANFYGQSVCLVEYLCSLRDARSFVAFMREANQIGEAAAIQKHYGLTLQELDQRLRNWIVTDRMPTLLRKDIAAR
jgi:hypothetical protein